MNNENEYPVTIENIPPLLRNVREDVRHKKALYSAAKRLLVI